MLNPVLQTPSLDYVVPVRCLKELQIWIAWIDHVAAAFSLNHLEATCFGGRPASATEALQQLLSVIEHPSPDGDDLAPLFPLTGAQDLRWRWSSQAQDRELQCGLQHTNHTDYRVAMRVRLGDPRHPLCVRLRDLAHLAAMLIADEDSRHIPAPWPATQRAAVAPLASTDDEPSLSVPALPLLYTKAEFAALAKKSVGTIDSWIRDGMRGVCQAKPNASVLIDWRKALTWLEEKKRTIRRIPDGHDGDTIDFNGHSLPV